jgi:hypothetical protein
MAFVNITVQERPNVRPTVKIESPANNSFVKGSLTISGSAKDDNKVTYVEIRVDPTGKWQKTTGTRYWSFELDTRDLELGRHTVYVRAYDGEDYSDEANIAFTVDNPVAGQAESSSFIPGFGTAAAVAAVAIALAAVGMARRRD